MTPESVPPESGDPEPYDTNPWPLYLKRGPRRWPWVVAGMVLLVVVAGGAGALAQRDEGAPKAPQEPEPSVSIGTSSSSPSPSPSPSSSPTLEPARFVCWDGSRVARLAECTEPDGRAGLEHVFPSLAGQSCRALGGRPSAGLVLVVRCADELRDGSEVAIQYAQWESAADGVAHHDGRELVRDDAAGALGWYGQENGRSTAAFMYEGEPFSVTWFAADPEPLNLALSTGAVEVRPVDEVRGHPIP